MKLSEVFAGFFKAAAESGIEITADAVPAQELGAVTADVQPHDAPVSAEMQAQIEAQQKALEAAQAEIERMKTKARDARLGALAATFYGETAAHVAILAALPEGSPAFQAYVAQQQATAELARQSALFSGAGSDRQEAAGAWAVIEQRAKALQAQTPGLSFEQATVQVMDADQALYAQYVSEQR